MVARNPAAPIFSFMLHMSHCCSPWIMDLDRGSLSKCLEQTAGSWNNWLEAANAHQGRPLLFANEGGP